MLPRINPQPPTFEIAMLAPTRTAAAAGPSSTPSTGPFSYNPSPGSLVERVLLLLARNLTAEYSNADLNAELDTNATGWLKTMHLGIQHGLCKYLPGENIRDPGVWRAGPHLAQWYQQRQAEASLRAQAADVPPAASEQRQATLRLHQPLRAALAPTAPGSKPGRRGNGGKQAQLPLLVPSAVVFHAGGREKPATTRQSATGQRISRYDWVFEQLQAQPVGASAVLPLAYLGTLKSTAKKRQKKGQGKYTVLRINDEQMEIWRDA
jgi:hypothetical protein